MAKKGRRSQRRRKQRRRAVKPLDRMHMALGNFLTEMGRLEFRVLLIGNMLSEEPMEYLFEGYAKLTFGPKIAWLKDRCAKSETMGKYKAELERIYAEMDGLLKKRNYLTHGETYEESFKGKCCDNRDLNRLSTLPIPSSGISISTANIVRRRA